MLARFWLCLAVGATAAFAQPGQPAPVQQSYSMKDSTLKAKLPDALQGGILHAVRLLYWRRLARLRESSRGPHRQAQPKSCQHHLSCFLAPCFWPVAGAACTAGSLN